MNTANLRAWQSEHADDFRRMAGRVVLLGYRSNPTQLCAWLRQLTNTQGNPAPSQPATI